MVITEMAFGEPSLKRFTAPETIIADARNTRGACSASEAWCRG